MSEWVTVNGDDRERIYHREGRTRIVGYVYRTTALLPTALLPSWRWHLGFTTDSAPGDYFRTGAKVYQSAEWAQSACDAAFLRFAEAVAEARGEM